MFNPFALTGFQFLLFYLLFGIVVWAGLRRWIAHHESEGERLATSYAKDPYYIAFLRGGAREALKIATISLVDRGLLRVDGELLTTKSNDALLSANRPIERAVLSRYLAPGNAEEILHGAESIPACKEYQQKLIEQELIRGPHSAETRLVPGIIAFACLWTTTAVKTSIALSQGRHNLIFLFILTAIFSLLVLFVLVKRTTARGDALLADLRILFARLKVRASKIAPGGQTNEAALVAAIFGIGVLPNLLFPYVSLLYPDKSSDGGGTSCGSSSSSDSGGGSSCGGGCGGGCGG